MLRKIIILFYCMSLLCSCSQIAELTTPAKKPQSSNSPLAAKAQENFWTTLHAGDYDNIPQAEKLLLAAYLENPNDPQLAAHLGFLHIWQLAERARSTNNDPDIVNNAILANKYFADAVTLDPSDARYLGFWGVTNLVEGKIFADQRQQTKGYFILKQAIHAWPQFNYFTAGYPMSDLSATSALFKEGLNWQWQTLNLCAKTTIDHNNPDFSPYLKLATNQGPERACWNSWIAPYNFEGFFLNMGDMLVKAGDWQTAIKIYRNAQLADNYVNWPYRTVLEDRIQNAKENVVVFNQPSTYKITAADRNKIIMFNSEFACMACHQVTKN